MGLRSVTLALTVGSPSAHRRSTMLKLLSVLVLMLTFGVGQMWAGYSSNFTNKDLGVGTGELTWTASPAFYSYESSGSARGAQSSKATSDITITSANISGTVTKIEVVGSMNGAGSMTAKVGGSSFGSSETIAKGDSKKTYTFNGSATVSSKAVEIKVSRSASATFWVKSITITTSSGTKYTVNYDANGGSVTPSSHTQASAGAAITTPTPTKTGYSCTGWYTETSGGTKRCNAGGSYTPTASETVHAQWSCIEPTINTQPAIGASPAALSVSATLSSGTLTYLWKVSTNGGSTWSNASGTNNQATYAAANISTASAGTTKYKCIVTNSSGSCSTESNVASITVYATHKAYFYNGSTLLNTGGTDIAEGATVAYSGSEPVSCDEGEGASTTFVGWATDTWSDKKAAKGDIPGGITFYDITASQSLPNMSTSDVTYYAVFAKATGGGSTTLLSENFSGITSGNSTSTSGSNTSWTPNSNFSGSSNPYQAGGAVRLGTGSNPGYLVTKQLTAAIGDQITVSFKVKGWSSVEGDIRVSGNNSEFTTPSDITYTATMSGSFQSKSVTVTLTKANPYIKIATTAKRAFLDDIVITKPGNPTYSNYLTTCCTPLVSINGSFNRYHLKIFHHIIMSMFISLIFKC